MIVEDQLDRRMCRIGGVEKREEFDEFAAAAFWSKSSTGWPCGFGTASSSRARAMLSAQEDLANRP
jgi:hypothetical protein